MIGMTYSMCSVGMISAIGHVMGEAAVNKGGVSHSCDATPLEHVVIVAVGVIVAGYTLYMTNFGYGVVWCSTIAGIVVLCCILMIRTSFAGALIALAVVAIGAVMHVQLPMPIMLIVVVAGVLAIKCRPRIGILCVATTCVAGMMDTNMYLHGVAGPNRIALWVLCTVISIGGGLGFWLHAKQQRIDDAVSEANRRRRIARTLHDQVANDINDVIMMVDHHLVQSGPDPQLERIRATSAHALANVRHAIMELEDCPVPASTKPMSTCGQGRKESALYRRAREYDDRLHAAGFHGELLMGEDLPDGGANSELIDDLMHELFGNIMKYADKGKPYFIMVSSTESQIGIGVTNMVRNQNQAQSGLGSGMRALAERIEKTGGTFEMGWDGPYWNVQASVPII